jgi:hypothetical protein
MSQEELMIKMVISSWESQNARVDKLLEKLTDEQLMTETAPGRNTGVYLLGHLLSVNDGMLTLLGFGEKKYPELEAVFLKNPDKSGLEKPSIAEIKKSWKEVNEQLSAHMAKLSPEEWLGRHTAVSEEDFAKEPHRNKLSILISRAIHQGYHLGQLAYIG